ncbi:FMN-binding protein [Gudongella sp. DL1XJH-153]|uniref:FMN-binding protein n=1 Tax=Gudongella sp. DL1XJH-153 TaxID=3409804 RepID=UPI003BB53926
MKKLLVLLLAFAMAFSMAACSTAPEEEPADAVTLTGVGEGFGGPIEVKVMMAGDTIKGVEIVSHSETPGISDPAIEETPAAIVEANSTEVDAVSGATYTSDGIIYAVNNAIDPDTYPAPVEEEPEDPSEVTASDVYLGFGISNMGRKGPGADNEEVQVWSINQVLASVLFDGEGRILEMNVDQLEIATPNYDGDGMPHFSGFPGQGGYNWDENHDEVVDGKTPDTEENFFAEIDGWMTKRERGDSYVMGNGKTWVEHMDGFQKAFAGMTVEEVKDWFDDYTSDRNGRPLKDGSEDAEDKAKYDALTDDEKAMLADVTSSATMSLNDSHGDIVAAIELAYENRKPLEIEEASSYGLGIASMGRKGPGADNEEVQVWSINQVVANSLFDEEGKLVALHVDQMEIATPNYDGDGMPHFSGFPGQGGYNFDEDHDEVVDGKTPDTEENFFAEIDGWMTKRERGDSYVMGNGKTWVEHMDKFEEAFIGMTAEELEDWFDKYTSDRNGRPLKDGSDDAEDKAKYDALTDDEKAMLADVTSAATMSLNDSHGDIIAAIKASYENRKDIDLKIE